MEVAPGEAAPVLFGERAEGGMIAERLTLMGREAFENLCESIAVGFEVFGAFVNELGGGGSSFGPGEFVDDEIAKEAEAHGGPLFGDLHLTHRGAHGICAMGDHLRGVHLSPKRFLIGRQAGEAGEEFLPYGGIPDGFHRRYASAWNCGGPQCARCE